MPNPKIETLIDAFAAGTINTALWNNITGGAATLDTLNNLITLQQPTTNGTANVFGTTSLFDATSSSIYAEVGPVPNGNGGTKTILKVNLDANNAVSMRVEAGVFKLTLLSAGVTTNTTLPTYNPNTHRWWRIREAAGVFYADTAPDGMTWTNQAQTAYTWNATAVTFLLQTAASTTEVAGNVAWIAHVNTPLGGQLNPNWPQTSYDWAPYWNANGAAQPLDRYTSVSRRTRSRSGVRRGRQYELDQIRSGTIDMTLANTDGALDPLNTSGPWYGHVMPYQPTRIRAQWPPTINLLTQVQATGGDLGGYSAGTIPQGSTGIAVNSATDSTGGTITATASAWQGSSVFQFTVPATTAANSSICATSQPAVQTSTAYTLQLQVRNVTASTSLNVQAYIAWYNAAGSLISTTTGTATTLTGAAAAAWTQVTASGTAPSNTAYATIGIQTTATSPGSPVSVQVDGWQLETGTQASVWTAPGVVYPLYSGFVERWPSSWTMQGTYGLVTPTGVDTLSLLSQRVLRDPLTEEIYSRSPRFLYTLGDPQSSSVVADATGNLPLAQIAVSHEGAGSLTLGNQITSTGAGGTYTGSSGTVARLANNNPGANTIGASTFISLGSAGITGPAGAIWSRMLAFRYTGSTPAYQAMLWAGTGAFYGESPQGGQTLQLYIDVNGKVNFFRTDTTGTGATVTSTNAVVDGNWHLVMFGMDNTGKAFINVDGVDQRFTGGVGNSPTTLVTDNIGALVNPVYGGSTVRNMQGDLSFACEWPILLQAADCTAIYTAWKNACTGDSSDTRYKRILGWANFTGPTSVQTGLTTSMGPAVVAGQDALSALQAVVDTENGEHFVDRAGVVTFRARSARYNALTPVYVFGENAAGGELPYEEVGLDYDPTRLANQVKVTQASTSQVFSGQDQTSINNFFPRQLTRAVNSTSAQECQDAANYLLSRYKNPAVRVSTIKLHPSANPSVLWPACLSLELGMRVRVMRRPPAPAAAIQADCFIESIQWDIDDQADAWVTLQCSPADLTPYSLFAAFHTTLASSIASGVGSISINAGQNNTDLAAAQLPVGGQLVLGQNTANQETVTIKSVGTTSPGWTTATITLTANTTKSHTAGDVVCEPLPAGFTDPTTWDQVSRFDFSAFSY